MEIIYDKWQYALRNGGQNHFYSITKSTIEQLKTILREAKLIDEAKNVD